MGAFSRSRDGLAAKGIDPARLPPGQYQTERWPGEDEPGFWERNGYHMYGDPWQEQRYWGD